MRTRARRFTLNMVGASALVVCALAGMNYLVDPYDRFGNNRLGVYIFAEREVKPTEVRRYPHDALYVGNSRMQAIRASDLEGFRFFNGAFAAATPEEMYWFIHHFAHGIKLVVVGIDLGVNDPRTPKGDVFTPADWASTFEHLVNFQSVGYSFKTIVAHWKGEPSHYFPDGSPADRDWGNERRLQDPAVGRMEMERYKKIAEGVIREKPPSLTYLQKIADTLRERKIACVAVIPPIHEEVWRHLQSLSIDGEIRAWKKRLGEIFPHVVDLSASDYGRAGNFYVRDPLHYKGVTGTAFMTNEVLPVAREAVKQAASGDAPRN